MINLGGDNDLGLYRARSHRRSGRTRLLVRLSAGLLAVAILATSALCGALGYGRGLFI